MSLAKQKVLPRPHSLPVLPETPPPPHWRWSASPPMTYVQPGSMAPSLSSVCRINHEARAAGCISRLYISRLDAARLLWQSPGSSLSLCKDGCEWHAMA